MLSEPTSASVRAILDAVPDPLVLVDVDGVVRFVNARAEVFFGNLRHQLLGRPVGGLVPGLDAVAARMLAEQAPDERHELTAVRATEDEIPVEVRLARIGVEDGEMLTVSVRDDSERRSLRDASAQMRDELFASVSHELRTPLTSILGYTELLIDMGEGAVSDRAAELLAIIERNALRELRLVEDLLTIASLGGDRLQVAPEPAHLSAVLEDTLAALRQDAVDAGLELTSTAPDDVWVCGDRRRLRQVIRNLVGNAFKFTPEGGRVSVELTTDCTHAELVVVDQGVGVDADELPRLFEELYRGSHAVERHTPGVGLGLPIVKGIIDAHGGDIDVVSARGEGTRVVVRLPLASAGCC